jgi:hypothetical protein
MAEKEIEKKNFENLVWFYREELGEVSKGYRASTLFPKGLRKRLLDMGVLVYRKGRHNLKYLISTAAFELLCRFDPKLITK